METKSSSPGRRILRRENSNSVPIGLTILWLFCFLFELPPLWWPPGVFHDNPVLLDEPLAGDGLVRGPPSLPRGFVCPLMIILILRVLALVLYSICCLSAQTLKANWLGQNRSSVIYQAVGPWACYLIPLCLNFLICKMEVLILPTS